MEKANRLSRRLDWKIRVERNNEEQTLVKKEWLEAKGVRVVEVMIEKVDLPDKVRKCEVKDDEVVKAVEEIK